MRTIFLSVPAGHNVANLLRGVVLSQLLAREELRVVILSPFSIDPRFTSEFAHPRVAFEVLHAHRPRKLERVVDSILSERFLLETGLTAPRLQRDRARLTDGWRGRRALVALKSAVSRLPVSRWTWFQAAEACVPRGRYAPLFARYRPALIVTATAGFLLAEIPLIATARAHGVPTVGADLGWDNLSSKYRPIRRVDYLTVWNEAMRDEAVRYHGFTPDRVSVSGAVQFDPYFRGDALEPRQEFLRAIGADSNRCLVTLATPPYTMYPSAGLLVETLAQAVAGDRLGPPAQLLVRVHPRDDLEAYQAYRARPHVLVEKPIARMQAVEGIPPYDVFSPTVRNRRHLAATLAHSDVLVNFASTTTVEACIFDTPVVNVGFDETPGLPLPLSIRRYYAYEHYQPVIEIGAVKVAASPDDLVARVRRYLMDRSHERAERRALVERLCAFTDGWSGRRVAQAILDRLGPAGAIPASGPQARSLAPGT